MWKSPKKFQELIQQEAGLLMLIADDQYGDPLLKQSQLSAIGGCDLVLLRTRQMSFLEQRKFFQGIEAVSPQTIKILNGPFDPSRLGELGIQGIHLPFSRALSILGSPYRLEQFNSLREQLALIIGVSIHSVAEWQIASALNPDYCLISNVFETTCKPGSVSKGTEWLNVMCHHIRPASLPIALGGIQIDHCQDILNAGAEGVAIRSGLLESKSPELMANRYKSSLKKPVLSIERALKK